MSDRYEIYETEDQCVDCGIKYQVYTVKDNKDLNRGLFCLCNKCINKRNEEDEKEQLKNDFEIELGKKVVTFFHLNENHTGNTLRKMEEREFIVSAKTYQQHYKFKDLAQTLIQLINETKEEIGYDEI